MFGSKRPASLKFNSVILRVIGVQGMRTVVAYRTTAVNVTTRFHTLYATAYKLIVNMKV